MGPFKKYVTCIMELFISFTCVRLCQFYCATSPALFTRNNRLWNGRKEDYFTYGWFSVSRYIKEVKNRIFRLNRIFRHTCMDKQGRLIFISLFIVSLCIGLVT